MRKLNFLNNRSESVSTKTTLISQKLLIGALALVLVAGMTSPAFALTIDSFTNGTINFTVDGGNLMDSDSNSGLPLLETIGGVRNVTGIMTLDGGTDIDGMANPPPGLMAWSAGSGSAGNLTLTWNGTDGNSGLGAVDLTLGGAGDRILVNMTDADMNSKISMWVWDTAGKSCSLEDEAVDDGPNEVFFPYADFILHPKCEDTDTDFTSIETIMLKIEGLEAGDYEIDLVGVPQMRVGGMVGSMSTASLLVAGAQANMGLWSIALVGAVATGAAIIYKTKSGKSEQ